MKRDPLFEPGASGSDERLLDAYKAAKARHDAAIEALTRSSKWRRSPDPELLKRQAEAAMGEFQALSALRNSRS